MTNQMPADEVPVEYVPAQVQVKPYEGLRTVACVVTLGGLMVNPLGLVSILGIVFTAIVLARMGVAEAAGRTVTMRGFMVATLVIGIVSTLLFVYGFMRAATVVGTL